MGASTTPIKTRDIFMAATPVITAILNQAANYANYANLIRVIRAIRGYSSVAEFMR